MTKVRKQKLTWKASASPQVTGYKVYWTAGNRLDYQAPCTNVGNVTAIVIPDDLTRFLPRSGDLKFGVTAIDSAGNESEMSIIEASGLFQAPSEPSGICIEAHADSVVEIRTSVNRHNAAADGRKPTRKRPATLNRPNTPAVSDNRRTDRVEETRDALMKIDKLLSRFFQED